MGQSAKHRVCGCPGLGAPLLHSLPYRASPSPRRRSQPGGSGGLEGKLPHTLRATGPVLKENVHITWGLRTSFTI